MEFSYSSEQTAFQDSIRRFCRSSYSFKARQELLASEEGFSRPHWKFFAEQGWLAATLPEDVGGLGGSPVEASILLEEFGRALVVEPYLSCVVFAGQLVDAAGSAEQRSALLGAVAAGELMLAVAHGEAETRGIGASLATRAQELGQGGYLLDGHKVLVLGGPSADKFIVSARLPDPRGGADGVSLFLVDRDAPGLTRQDYRMVDGFRAADLTLSGVRVGPDALLGEPGQGLAPLERAIDHALVAMAAEACGAMDTLVWLTRDYLKTRSQYGATLNTYQALQHRMADMLIESEMSRAMLLQGLAALGQPDTALRRSGASAAKVQVGQSGYFVGKNAIQLHGGIGVTEEFSVGHYFRRLVSIGYLLGDASYHLQRFAAAF